ncbi:MAG: tyrosine-type recombinase/integrase [Planctomycetes bacterium]|nr:tyrosine-type recombinase/integrase [Planctomycetota bacterium]
MDHWNIVPIGGQITTLRGGAVIPRLFLDAGEDACRRYLEFFAATIRNQNTRQAYLRAVTQFANWCERHGVALREISPLLTSLYIEELGQRLDRPSVKQHLAAIRMLCDWLVIGHVLPVNPTASVRGPKHVVKRGKTPVLTSEQARQLLDSIDVTTIVGLRDRAMIAAMVFSFARISALLGMNVEDYYPDGKRYWLRLHEKGGKFHEVPAHHKAEEYLDEYILAAGINNAPHAPLFRSIDRRRQLTDRRLSRREALAMIKRRARAADVPDRIGCHTFRATGITAYLLNGGTLEHAQRIAAHESPRTTKLYDRTTDEITLDEIERISI